MVMLERETNPTEHNTEPAAIAHRAASTSYEAAGCMGAACGAVVRLEEQAALDDYQAEMTAPHAVMSQSKGAPDE
ncbi:MAG: hypothetical protein JNM89_03240 [Hyphomicrobiaceae bacterium]|nr:hypothetical protein [Hyphomicrobiaceae bacterium]